MKGILFKYRGLVWGVFVAAVLVLPVSFSRLRFCAAVPILLAGQCLRFWAAGVIQKYRTLSLDAPQLVTWGPYAWVRNPLYAGNGLMGLGWALMTGWPMVAAFAAVYFALYSITIIPYEEQFLSKRFGEEYEIYRRSTPALIPGVGDLASRAGKAFSGFNRRKSWYMERHSLNMNLIVTALLLIKLYKSP
ncbi:MAG: isoprenylcysteine carboxylmethyltransferase family protein [Synergistaceae bacterium]|nr:isoprenylcysteine carboxylmethyltransferase family protein [Synergistaceae bacterium]